MSSPERRKNRSALFGHVAAQGDEADPRQDLADASGKLVLVPARPMQDKNHRRLRLAGFGVADVVFGWHDVFPLALPRMSVRAARAVHPAVRAG
ncbi:hypothetical protein LAZ29_11165 [Cereibacter sphaeroides]|uniref:hypothetical protein n=1 Tax=Cereibacter sphaeroides TaxID=1063 RepID=UPI001F2290A7|nr:hypothetical protein [Cereibacter sphaeroides]MCE6951491.1 hypothetical protein [Cereibacter sphaeroides]